MEFGHGVMVLALHTKLLKICVAHLNAADFGPIQVDSGSIPVRLSCVAGAKAPAAGLQRVRFWFESGRVMSVPVVCLVLKRAELSDSGAMRLLKA